MAPKWLIHTLLISDCGLPFGMKRCERYSCVHTHYMLCCFCKLLLCESRLQCDWFRWHRLSACLLMFWILIIDWFCSQYWQSLFASGASPPPLFNKKKHFFLDIFYIIKNSTDMNSCINYQTSIGYQIEEMIGDDRWLLYTEPIKITSTKKLIARAIRIGFKASNITSN